jgi:hypothetical protein
LKDAHEKLRAGPGRAEDPAIAATDNILGALVGIHYAVAAISARANSELRRGGTKLTREDRDELNRIVDLANAIQDEHLRLRAIVSEHYQRGR